jgi:RimJ/RimL family protein N-acetyltransferase
LTLRRWRQADAEPFAALNSHAEVSAMLARFAWGHGYAAEAAQAALADGHPLRRHDVYAVRQPAQC